MSEAALDLLELDGGQFSIAVDVVERNGQQAFMEAAKPAEPAPLSFEPERTAAELREELEQRSPEELERIAAAPGAMPAARKIAAELAAKPKSSKKPARTYRCAYCSRELKNERWVYSSHTGSRYCTPGEGCQTPAAYRKQERARARKEG